ncbi:hypothetical protein HON36_06025 [Candidatus Parcubacteria bacterium]|jgi:hypothetical protein|nr:hypothetical protein [Candidatus Parcubacteria bacterium]MBT7227959.1 hypothetical protein [Candidatus Parcubacteria bacterium]
MEDELQKLPVEVKEVIFSQDFVKANNDIVDKFSFNRAQQELILSLEESLFLKKISPLDLSSELEDLERADYYDLRKVGLEIALNILWPLQEYLKTVDRLILRLGGKVPRLIRLKRTPVQKKVFPDLHKGYVREMIKEFDDFKDLRLTAKKIIDKSGRLVISSIDNWIKDYIHFLGAGYHNSLQRSQYLAKSPNVKALNLAEKELMRHFITSYDDNVEITLENKSGVLVVIEEEETSKERGVKKPTEIKIDKVVANLQKQLTALEADIMPTDFILSEAENDIKKLGDVLWKAVGLQDKNKVLSCLKVMVEKKFLDSMLVENNRFKNILKRFVNITYGIEAERGLSQNSDKLIARRLFLQMLLADKLRLKEREATLLSFYLTNLLPGSGQVVYLDQNDGELKWREIHSSAGHLAWVDQVTG